MWLEAMELENYVMVSWHAGGRKKRADANEERGNSLVRNEVGALLPFDGGVTLRVDEWLEANMHGDKAESTSRAYQSSWQKWVAWARRQAWDCRVLGPQAGKARQRKQVVGVPGLHGVAGSVTCDHEADFGIHQGLPQESRSWRPYRRNVPYLATGQLVRSKNLEEAKAIRSDQECSDGLEAN